jgi:hypothetical protein
MRSSTVKHFVWTLQSHPHLAIQLQSNVNHTSHALHVSTRWAPAQLSIGLFAMAAAHAAGAEHENVGDKQLPPERCDKQLPPELGPADLRCDGLPDLLEPVAGLGGVSEVRSSGTHASLSCPHKASHRGDSNMASTPRRRSSGGGTSRANTTRQLRRSSRSREGVVVGDEAEEDLVRDEDIDEGQEEPPRRR